MTIIRFPLACKVCGFIATKGAMTLVNHETRTGHHGWAHIEETEA